MRTKHDSPEYSHTQEDVENVLLRSLTYESSVIQIDNGNLLYANTNTANVFGLGDGKTSDLSLVLACVHPDDYETVEMFFSQVVIVQKHCQYRLVSKENNTVRWIQSCIFRYSPDNNADTRMVVHSSDITGMHENNELRKQAEISARTSEEKYKLLTSLLPEMVFETNLDGQLLFVNLKAITVFEYGSDFYINNLNFIELISYEDQRRYSREIKKIAAADCDAFEMDCNAVTKFGRKFPVKLHITKTYANNILSGLNILMLDQTIKKYAENYQQNLSFLSKSALNFLTLSNDDDIFIFVGKNLSKFASRSIVAVFSYDQNSDISKMRYVSSGIYAYLFDLMDILGKPLEEHEISLPDRFKSKYLSDKTLKKLDNLNGFWDEAVLAKIEKIENLLNIDNYYSMGIVRDGKLYGGLLIATTSKSKSIDTQTIETFIYQAGIALHRKQIDNELMKAKLVAEESDRLKSAFLANMSHELRTPLNGILGLAQVMLNSENIAPEVHNNVKIIVESGNSLLSLIEDILDLSKIEADQLKIKNMPFILNTLMAQLYSIFSVHPVFMKKNVFQKNIKLMYDKPDEVISILSDPDRIKQIFFNLICNALKFTQNGFVRFGCTVENDEITFYVKDSGIGIPQDQQETIFARFTQVDSTLSRKFKGSGLGLAISKGLTTLLNGDIWCESELGKGSTFYFKIPYIPAEIPILTEISNIDINMDYKWCNNTILVVEDDVINFKVIEAMLRSTKVKIIHASNGLQAIETITKNPQISLVLMDVHLPEMSGLEATTKIKEINPTLPVIAQTANAMAEDREICIAAGCADYISKPIDMKELLGKMGRYMSGV